MIRAAGGLLLLALGCGGGSSGGGGAGQGGGGGAGGGAADQATFSAIYTDIIVATGCNGSPLCHGGATGGNLIMNGKAATYAALVGVAAMGTNLIPGKTPDCKDSGLERVVPGDPDNSLLVKKIEQTPPCGDPMPPTGVKLADAQIQLIRTWIQNGAKDN